MRDYIVSGRAAGFGPGYLLLLTAAQAAPRRHNLQAVDPATIEDAPLRAAVRKRLDTLTGARLVAPVAPIEFKRGETVAVVAGAVNKAAFEHLAEPGSLAAEAVAAALERKAAQAITAKEKRAIREAEAAEARELAAKRKSKKAVTDPDTGKPVNATRAAADLAAAVNVALGSVTGTGPDGLIRAADVRAAREELARDRTLADPSKKATVATVTQHDAR